MIVRAVFFLLWLLLIFPVYGQEEASSYAMKAEAKMEEEDYQYAMVLIDEAIALNETDLWLYFKKAEIQFRLSGSSDALKVLKQALIIDPEEAEIYNRAGSLYQSALKLDSAIIMFNRAIDHAENDTIQYSYLQNRATAKADKRDFEGALKDFETVLAFDPNDLATLNNIASVYRELGMTGKGISCLKKIITIDSSFIGPYVNLGFIYSQLDSIDLAIQYFDKALAIDPNEPLIYSNRGYAYYKKGAYSKALQDINKSISIYPTNSYAYRNLALVYIELESMEEACNALDYAKRYGFTQSYGNEVEKLTRKYCK